MHAVVYLEDNEYIALCDLLKLAGLTDSGGQAKAAIARGLVFVMARWKPAKPLKFAAVKSLNLITQY